jgi:AcrR family transcriptional regulator
VTLDNLATAPQQERSRQTHAKILAAGAELLRAEGAQALVVSEVAEKAGVSVGSVYRRFGTKDQLLLVIQDEFLNAFHADFVRRIAPADREGLESSQIVDIAVRSLAETFRARRHMYRVLFLIGTEPDKVAMRTRGLRADRTVGLIFTELLRKARHAITRPDPELAIDFTFRLVYSASAHRVIHGTKIESTRPLTWAAFISEMRETAHAYLFSPVR